MRTGIDDDLPAYSSVDPQKLQNGVTLENMDMDEDEGVGGVEDLDPHQSGYNLHNGAQWSFNQLNDGSTSQQLIVPPGSDIADDESIRHGSAFSGDGRNRMADFADDEGTISGVFGTPPEGHEAMEETHFAGHSQYDDEPVAEVTVPGIGNEEGKME